MPARDARREGGNGDARADASQQLDLEADALDPGALNLPAEIDLITRQIGEARDLTTVLEIRNRAEALLIYCKKHSGLVEAHNRLAGVIARTERRIGQEIRAAQQRGELATRADGTAIRDHVPSGNKVVPAKLADVGLTRKQSHEYQEMASAEEGVILDAIAKAGAEGREVSKKDIRSAVKEHLGKQPRPAQPAPSADRYDPAKRIAFELEAEFGGSTKMFSVIDRDPREVARAIDPLTRQDRRLEAIRTVTWLNDFLETLGKIDGVLVASPPAPPEPKPHAFTEFHGADRTPENEAMFHLFRLSAALNRTTPAAVLARCSGDEWMRPELPRVLAHAGRVLDKLRALAAEAEAGGDGEAA